MLMTKAGKELGMLAALVVLCAVTVGCSSASLSGGKKSAKKSARTKSSDPVKSFDALRDSIERQIAKPREYLERSTGTYNEEPNFSGKPEDAGQPFEKYDRLFRAWRIKGYDVKQTDSLVSPYQAILVLERRKKQAFGGEHRLQKPEDVLGKPYEWDSGWQEQRCTYNWRDGSWVPGKNEWPFDPEQSPEEEKNGGRSDGRISRTYTRL